MSRFNVQNPENSRRLLASAIGMAVAAMSAPHMAQAADQGTDKKTLSLDATNITGEATRSESYKVERVQARKVTASESYKVEKVQSQKYTAPLLDTPRTVTVVPQQVIKDTGALTLQDALRTVPGITMGAGEGGNPAGDRPFIRGFDSQNSIYLDGVRDVGAQTREIFAVDSVEVAKGPNSSIGGRSAGGTINLVTKKAHLGDSLDGAWTFGSDQTHRYTLDGNYQLNDTSAFRLNLMSHESNVAGRDAVNYDRWGVAPSLAFGLGTDTRVNIDYYHVESNDLPDSGIPYSLNSGSSAARTKANPDKPDDGGDSSNYYGLKARDFYKSRADIATISVEHDLNDSLMIKNTLRHGSTLQDYIITQPDDSKGNILNNQVFRRANTRVASVTTTTNQTDLSGDFYVGGFKNTFDAGVELTRETTVKTAYTVAGTSSSLCNTGAGLVAGVCTSFSDPNPNEAFGGTVTRNYAGTNTAANTGALYFLDTLELTPAWLLNMGLRYDRFNTISRTKSAARVTTYQTEDTSEFINGQLGLTWKPAENGSVYISYATSATPPGASVGDGSEANALDSSAAISSDLEAEKTKNYEIGTKWDLFDDRLSLAGAIFRTEKDNARVLVDTNTYENIGKTRVDGVELSATGKLTDKWQVFAGYTYMDSEQVDGGKALVSGAYVDSPNNGNQLPNTPKNSFTLWNTYKITPKLTIGGGAFYSDKVYGNVANTVLVDSYWRYDAMASYKVSKNLDLQLNVQNLTDKVYYDKAYAAHWASMAPGRTALLTTAFHF